MKTYEEIFDETLILVEFHAKTTETLKLYLLRRG